MCITCGWPARCCQPWDASLWQRDLWQAGLALSESARGESEALHEFQCLGKLQKDLH